MFKAWFVGQVWAAFMWTLGGYAVESLASLGWSLVCWACVAGVAYLAVAAAVCAHVAYTLEKSPHGMTKGERDGAPLLFGCAWPIFLPLACAFTVANWARGLARKKPCEPEAKP